MQAIESRLPALYLLIALPITLLLCFLNAPFFTPDEQHHAARAIALSHGNLLAHIGPTGEAGSEIDANALKVMDAYDTLRMAWEKQSPNFLDRRYGPLSGHSQLPQANIRWTNTKAFAAFPNTAVYPPILYLPAIAGWRLAEAANLTILQSLRLARILCALSAVALGWLALRLCASTRWLLLAFLLLPTTLYLNASCSQDALLLSVTALLASILTRPLAHRRNFTLSELTITAALIALCATARPPYLALTLLLFLPVAQRSKEFTNPTILLFLPPATAFTLILSLYAAWRHLVAPFGFDPPDWASPDRQTAFLHAHPIASASAILKGTAIATLDLFHRGLYLLGNNDLLPPHALTIALLASLAVLLAAAPPGPVRTWPSRILLATAAIGSLLGISYAEYVIWTAPGHTTVWGIQPRYWLPILPFLILLVRGIRSHQSETRTPSASAPRIRLLLAALALLIAIDLTLPWMAAQAFYLETISHALYLNLR